MRYAVTGATGFVGGALVRLLRANGHDVVALVRNRERAEALSTAGVTLVEGDLDDSAALDRLVAGADGLFHVAGWYKLGDARPENGWRVNVDGTANVLAAARGSGVSRVVYTSTLAVNSDTHGGVVDEEFRFTGSHLSVYDETKARAHDLAVDAARDGLPLVVVQPGLVYGPGDTSQTGALVAAVLAGRRPTIPAGGAVCWGHVDDIALGHLLAMEQGTAGDSYFLAGEPCSLAEGLRLLADLAGSRVRSCFRRAWSGSPERSSGSSNGLSRCRPATRLRRCARAWRPTSAARPRHTASWAGRLVHCARG